MRAARTARWIAALAAAVGLASCEGSTSLPGLAPERTPHETYADRLRDAELERTALGRDWLAAAQAALDEPLGIALPYAEEGYLAPTEPAAVGYRFVARRGQRLVVTARLRSADPAVLFVDLFRVVADTGRSPEHVASADTLTGELAVELRDDGSYILRLQPELLRGGRFSLEARTEASLAFPIPGYDGRAIRSRWGAVRDAGRRLHEGIDIFAPRGTPVVAVAAGIAYPADNRLGGKVVFLRDPLRGVALYYAHLDSQAVQTAAVVRPGDTLGFVGNTGNARTTPPHLHFGIYRRGEGAVDPFPFVFDPDTSPPPLRADTALVGEWSRLSAAVSLRLAPADTAPAPVRLPRHTLVHVGAAVGGWYRIRTPDGAAGFVPSRRIEAARQPLRIARLDDARTLAERPAAGAVAVDSLPAGAEVGVIGRYGDYVYVRRTDGRAGWVAADAT